jgi:hypothetical protein
MIARDDDTTEPLSAPRVVSAPVVGGYCKNCGIQQPLSRPAVCPYCHKDPYKVQR